MWYQTSLCEITFVKTDVSTDFSSSKCSLGEGLWSHSVIHLVVGSLPCWGRWQFGIVLFVAGSPLKAGKDANPSLSIQAFM